MAVALAEMSLAGMSLRPGSPKRTFPRGEGSLEIGENFAQGSALHVHLPAYVEDMMGGDVLSSPSTPPPERVEIHVGANGYRGNEKQFGKPHVYVRARDYMYVCIRPLSAPQVQFAASVHLVIDSSIHLLLVTHTYMNNVHINACTSFTHALPYGR